MLWSFDFKVHYCCAKCFHSVHCVYIAYSVVFWAFLACCDVPSAGVDPKLCTPVSLWSRLLSPSGQQSSVSFWGGLQQPGSLICCWISCCHGVVPIWRTTHLHWICLSDAENVLNSMDLSNSTWRNHQSCKFHVHWPTLHLRIWKSKTGNISPPDCKFMKLQRYSSGARNIGWANPLWDHSGIASVFLAKRKRCPDAPRPNPLCLSIFMFCKVKI